MKLRLVIKMFRFTFEGKQVVDLTFRYQGAVEGSMEWRSIDPRTVTDWEEGDLFDFRAPIKVKEEEEG